MSDSHTHPHVRSQFSKNRSETGCVRFWRMPMEIDSRERARMRQRERANEKLSEQNKFSIEFASKYTNLFSSYIYMRVSIWCVSLSSSLQIHSVTQISNFPECVPLWICVCVCVLSFCCYFFIRIYSGVCVCMYAVLLLFLLYWRLDVCV